jgi:hypothetical protein
MARPYVFPDVNDRSLNSPSVIVSPQQVLGNYNQSNNDNRVQVTDVVKNWFADEAKKLGWSDATFHGNQCALSVKLKILK